MKNMRGALVIEDEPAIRTLVSEILAAEGFRVTGVGSMAAARSALDRDLPALVVLDRMLPDGDGLELCRGLWARPDARGVAVLVLSCRGRVEERVLGLRAGADDYLPKPFHPDELAARAAALVRRGAPDERPLESGPIRLDPGRHECTVEGRAVRLWRAEFELLRVLLERPGRLLTRDFLGQRVWGNPPPRTSRAVETTVQRLRRRLGTAGRRIETVRGCGFRLQEGGHR
ncbi:MAG: response regulator transcription factor [Elusimicrobia bacterium]|nr:response regulator transcription factor [Elusimicrobiota bacterium]